MVVRRTAGRFHGATRGSADDEQVSDRDRPADRTDARRSEAFGPTGAVRGRTRHRGSGQSGNRLRRRAITARPLGLILRGAFALSTGRDAPARGDTPRIPRPDLPGARGPLVTPERRCPAQVGCGRWRAFRDLFECPPIGGRLRLVRAICTRFRHTFGVVHSSPACDWPHSARRCILFP